MALLFESNGNTVNLSLGPDPDGFDILEELLKLSSLTLSNQIANKEPYLIRVVRVSGCIRRNVLHISPHTHFCRCWLEVDTSRNGKSYQPEYQHD